LKGQRVILWCQQYQIAVLKSSMHISIYWTDNAKIVDCKLNMIFFFFFKI